MKKLIITAAAVALVGGAFAAGNTFEYKASVKYVDMNKKTWKIDGNSHTVYVKTVKTATLSGYLVVDPKCPCVTPGEAPKHGFLIVENKAKKSGPKLFPANLYARVWKEKAKTTTPTAEGYLFAGKGVIAAVATPEAAQNWGDNTTKATDKLFGTYNHYSNGGAFYDSWLDAAGFGKASSEEDDDEGCDIEPGGECLINLSGSVIGGLFLCKDGPYDHFLCMNWEGTTDVISGTWSIKKTDKVSPLEDLPEGITAAKASKETLLYLGGAGKKMKTGWKLTDVEEAFRTAWF